MSFCPLLLNGRKNALRMMESLCTSPKKMPEKSIKSSILSRRKHTRSIAAPAFEGSAQYQFVRIIPGCTKLFFSNIPKMLESVLRAYQDCGLQKDLTMN